VIKKIDKFHHDQTIEEIPYDHLEIDSKRPHEVRKNMLRSPMDSRV